MEENSRKILTFFLGIILPIILIAISFMPGVGNILLMMIALIWLGFAILLVGPVED